MDDDVQGDKPTEQTSETSAGGCNCAVECVCEGVCVCTNDDCVCKVGTCAKYGDNCVCKTSSDTQSSV